MRDSLGRLFTVSRTSVVFNADMEVLSCYLLETNMISFNQSTQLAIREPPRIASMQTAHTRLPGALITLQSPIAMGTVAR